MQQFAPAKKKLTALGIESANLVLEAYYCCDVLRFILLRTTFVAFSGKSNKPNNSRKCNL